MLLGKRPRQPMKRTTSMKDVAVDLGAATPTAASKPSGPVIPGADDGNQLPFGHGGWNIDRCQDLTAESPNRPMALPRLPRQRSAEDAAAVGTAQFLRACALCKGFLRSGRDIYMYRGEVAFCSLECREQQIKLDERKERAKAKCSACVTKVPAQAKASAMVPEASANGEASASAADRLNLDQVIGLIL